MTVDPMNHVPARVRSQSALSSATSAWLNADVYKQAFDGAARPVALISSEGQIADSNVAFVALAGEGTNLTGYAFGDLVAPRERAVLAVVMAGVLHDSGGASATIELPRSTSAGHVVLWRITISRVDRSPEPAWASVEVDDVTALRSTERQLATSQRLTAVLARVARSHHRGGDVREEIVDAVVEVLGADAVTLIETVGDNDRVTAARGLPNEVQLSRPRAAGTMVHHVMHTSETEFVPDLSSDPRVNPEFILATRCQSAVYQPAATDGEVIAVLLAAFRSPRQSIARELLDALELLAAEAATVLVAERAQRDLLRSAMTDSLTGLANRRAWSGHAARLQADADRKSPAVLAIADLDNFKSYNDVHGHHEGDRVLRDFARYVTQAVADRGVVVRWGGEEFVIAMPNTSLKVAEPLLRGLTLAGAGRPSCSIGATTFVGHEPIETAIKRADQALNVAKDSGRGCLVVQVKTAAEEQRP